MMELPKNGEHQIDLMEEPKMPKLIKKIFREEKLRVQKVVFNRDKSWFAVLV